MIFLSILVAWTIVSAIICLLLAERLEDVTTFSCILLFPGLMLCYVLISLYLMDVHVSIKRWFIKPSIKKEEEHERVQRYKEQLIEELKKMK